MIILGVDPGSIVTGYGIITKEKSRTTHLASGVVRVSAKHAQSKRLWEIHQKLDLVIREHRPEIMVVESLFHAENSQSLMKLSQARGVILLLGEAHGLEICEYSPMEIKKGVTGYGRAEKHQMVYMVARLLGLPNLKSADQADALAMALYHANICRGNGGLQ
jgi:crossover junction endodeoxyribonuclease RuvC